jgi:hypothetical protein
MHAPNRSVCLSVLEERIYEREEDYGMQDEPELRRDTIDHHLKFKQGFSQNVVDELIRQGIGNNNEHDSRK